MCRQRVLGSRDFRCELYTVFFIKCPVIGELVAALARLAASLGPYGKFPCIEVYAKGVINQDVLSCGQSL